MSLPQRLKGGATLKCKMMNQRESWKRQGDFLIISLKQSIASIWLTNHNDDTAHYQTAHWRAPLLSATDGNSLLWEGFYSYRFWCWNLVARISSTLCVVFICIYRHVWGYLVFMWAHVNVTELKKSVKPNWFQCPSCKTTEMTPVNISYIFSCVVAVPTCFSDWSHVKWVFNSTYWILVWLQFNPQPEKSAVRGTPQ